MSVAGTNFGKAAADYGTYRAGFPDSLFERLAAFAVGRSGHLVVDLGTGTGTLARGFALRGCDVIGVDPDTRMLAQSKALICAHNPRWDLGGGMGLYPQWLPDLSAAGMHGIETFSYDVDVPYTPEAWRGRIRASAAVAQRAG